MAFPSSLNPSGATMSPKPKSRVLPLPRARIVPPAPPQPPGDAAKIDPNKQAAMSKVNMSRPGRDAVRAENEYNRSTPGVLGATSGGTGLTPDAAWRKWFPTPGTKPGDEAGVSQADRTAKRVTAMAPAGAPPAPAANIAAAPPAPSAPAVPGTPPTPAPSGIVPPAAPGLAMNPANAEDGMQPSPGMVKTMNDFSNNLNPASAAPAPVADEEDEEKKKQNQTSAAS